MNPPIRKVRKAVLPAAGLGTRFLPATKAQPKEMLPVVDKPLIQYAVEECIASGIENVIIITGRRKNAIEDHFDSAPELERFLEERGKPEQAEMVRRISGGIHSSYTRQSEALGTRPCGDARARAGGRRTVCRASRRRHFRTVPSLGRNRSSTFTRRPGKARSSLKRVPRERVHLYGSPTRAPLRFSARQSLDGIDDVIEKPKREEAPSNLAVTGCYVFPPEIFDCLARIKPGSGGEIQLYRCDCACSPRNTACGATFMKENARCGRQSASQATVELRQESRTRVPFRSS